MTTDAFGVLPAPPGYLLITINDDDGDPIIENRISAPETVIGFVIRKQQGYFSVLPVTPSGVHDEMPDYVLIRADGKAEYSGLHVGGNTHIFASVEDWKQFMRRQAAECYSEMAEEFAKDGDKKGAADMRACARAHQKQIEKNDD
jgi:hypothetical protein